jgi:hypothetical protein
MEFCRANPTQAQSGHMIVQPLKTLYVKMDSVNDPVSNPTAPLRLSINLYTLHGVPSNELSRCLPGPPSGPVHPYLLRSQPFVTPQYYPSCYHQGVNHLFYPQSLPHKPFSSDVFAHQSTATLSTPAVNLEPVNTSLRFQSNNDSQDSRGSPKRDPTKPVTLFHCNSKPNSQLFHEPRTNTGEDRRVMPAQASAKIDPFESVSFSKLKHIMFQYFYNPDELTIQEPLTTFEIAIFRIFLIKKLVHDKKKSKIFFAIRNLCADELLQFLQSNPAVNRKNIIKSNIFKRAWKALEKNHRGHFPDHFFGALAPTWPKDSFSIKHYRKTHCFNLADEFYSRCFLSEKFKEEFFQVLEDAEFRDAVLRQSKQKFANCFDFWMTETIVFMQKAKFPLERDSKLPYYKFGMSAKDYEMAPSLFQRLMAKD